MATFIVVFDPSNKLQIPDHRHLPAGCCHAAMTIEEHEPLTEQEIEAAAQKLARLLLENLPR